MQKTAWLPLAALVLLSFAGLSASPAAAQTRPNIIFIMTDDLGYGDLATYGAESFDRRVFLFDLRRDIGERVNLAGTDAGMPITRRLKGLLDDWAADVDGEAAQPSGARRRD